MKNLHVIATIIICLILPVKGLFSQENPAYKNVKTKFVEIQGKKYVLQSKNIQVPEDKNKQGSRILTLPVQIIKSDSEKPLEPIFWLGGGPGGSNIVSVKGITSFSTAPLLENHDLVFVGYRGVDGSTVLNSKKVNKALKGLDHKLLSDASLDNIEKELNEYQGELKKRGIDINCYTILDVINDLEYARQVLDYKNIDLLSESYGTRVALLYSYKHPEVLKRTVMIGPNPPGHFVWQPAKTDQILNLYDSIYKAKAKVDYKGSVKEAMECSFNKMPKRWSLYKLDADKIKVGTFATLFSKDMAVMAFDAYFKAANKGDYSQLYLIQLLADMGKPEAIGEMFAKAYSADFKPGADYRKTLQTGNTALGGNMSVLYWGTANAWSMKMIPEEYRKCRMSSSETLVISGNLDVSTPSDFAKDELMPFLSNGQHVVLTNMSHSDIFRIVMKNRDFLSAYFDSGIVKKTLIDSPEEINFVPIKKFSKAMIFMMGLINRFP